MSATDPLDDLISGPQQVRRRDLRQPQTRRAKRAERKRAGSVDTVQHRRPRGRRAQPARRRAQPAPRALRAPVVTANVAPRRQPLVKRVAKKFAPVVALGFAAALIVGTSVPASVFSDASADAAPSITVPSARHRTATVDGQTVTSAAGAAAPVSREAFQAMSVAELDAIQEASASAGYTVNNSGPIRWPFPVAVPLGDRFGPRIAPCSGCSTFHNGTDFELGNGAPIYAVAAGVVTVSEYSGQLGQHVDIQHTVDGKTFTSVYGHMAAGSSPMHVGQVVAEGDVVGLVGSTGTSTGPHLDFEIDIAGTPVDSFLWLEANTAH